MPDIGEQSPLLQKADGWIATFFLGALMFIEGLRDKVTFAVHYTVLNRFANMQL